MTHEEQEMFTHLMFDHKHLWIAFQETRYLREFPDADPEEVHGRFVDAAYEIYQPLADALLEGQPIRDILQTILLASRIAHKLLKTEEGGGGVPPTRLTLGSWISDKPRTTS